MILGMLFLSKFYTIIDLSKWSIYQPKLGTHLTIDYSSILFPSSARIKLLQEDIKLAISKDFQITLDKLSINKMLLELTATYIQVLVNVTIFDPITEFLNIFSEKIPDELSLLRELNMHHWIKLIDPEKIINP